MQASGVASLALMYASGHNVAVASQWPELMPEKRTRPARTLAWSFTAAIIGGAVAWALFFLGLDLWGLMIGAAVIVCPAAGRVRGDGSQRQSESIVLSCACALLTWPLLWILAVFVRYWITGKSLGS